MPLYEEKLLSPLAVRFSQSRIRPFFQDNRCLEATVAEVRAGPGRADYDVVVEAPFPAIEVVRWSAKLPAAERTSSPSSSSQEGDAVIAASTPTGALPMRQAREEHWYTMDNRRLYCLQRSAVLLWPKRVAVVVQVPYSVDSGEVMKKVDTTDMGLSVSVCRLREAGTEAAGDVWCWKRHLTSSNSSAAQAALDRIVADDKTVLASALEGLEEESALTRLLRHTAAEAAIASARVEAQQTEQCVVDPGASNAAGHRRRHAARGRNCSKQTPPHEGSSSAPVVTRRGSRGGARSCGGGGCDGRVADNVVRNAKNVSGGGDAPKGGTASGGRCARSGNRRTSDCGTTDAAGVTATCATRRRGRQQHGTPQNQHLQKPGVHVGPDAAAAVLVAS
eukprot:TRINITY_DN27579_c0_g1_i1.p1 TRINITY_DN27579_c0_g1~~TRINITY_DN27579_c0_g1_i1.p1  ORF type:complete len:439 (+),score=65.72 TRINITY_DN27579_c0_g1_i1:145-1317(+)